MVFDICYSKVIIIKMKNTHTQSTTVVYIHKCPSFGIFGIILVREPWPMIVLK